MNRIISPERGDAFSDKTPARSYKEIMIEAELNKEEKEVKRAIAKKLENAKQSDIQSITSISATATVVVGKNKRRFDADDSNAGNNIIY